MWNKAVMKCFKKFYRHLPGRADKNHKIMQLGKMEMPHIETSMNTL
jgi:hypothetical protein